MTTPELEQFKFGNSTNKEATNQSRFSKPEQKAQQSQLKRLGTFYEKKEKTKDTDSLPDSDENKHLLIQVQEQFAKSTLYEIKLEDEKLYNADFLIKVNSKILKELQIIQLSKNYLSNIDLLNRFQNLRKISAGYNYISTVKLTLPKLMELDLKNNYLTKVPYLNLFPNLRVLNVRANKIEELSFAYLKNDKEKDNAPTYYESKVEKLNFAANQISFKTMLEAQKFADQINSFKNLKFLNVEQNKIKDSYIITIQQRINTVEVFNNVLTKKNKNAEAKQIIGDQDVDGQNEEDFNSPETNEEQKTVYDAQKKEKRTLESITRRLQEANKNPSKALKHIHILTLNAEAILNLSHLKLDQIFTEGKSQDDIDDLIETFTSNATMLVENFDNLRNSMFSVLAKLCCIPTHNFGLHCFCILRDLMLSGDQLRSRITFHIDNEIIRKIQPENFDSKTLVILDGLRLLVEKTGETELLFPLYEKPLFQKWLRYVSSQLTGKKNQQNPARFESRMLPPPEDAIVMLFATGLQEKVWLNMCEIQKNKKTLYPHVQNIILNTSSEQKRYLYLLKALNSMVLADQEAANYFMERVFQQIKNEIGITYNDYKKDFGLSNPVNQTENDWALGNQIFATQIFLMGSLLNASKEKRQKVFIDEPNNPIWHVITIINHSKADPLVLTSVCYLVDQLLKLDEIIYEPQLFDKLMSHVKDIKNLVDVLGKTKNDKFEIMIKAAQKYNNQKKLLLESEGSKLLANLDDKTILDLFNQIIRLINRFSLLKVKFEEELFHVQLDDPQVQQMKRGQSQQVFDQNSKQAQRRKEVISRHLPVIKNQIKAFLKETNCKLQYFKCLDIPSDEIKLQIVQGLKLLNPAKFQPQEIATIIQILNYQNLGAGMTELVISTVIFILQNMMTSNHKDFYNKYIMTVIKDSIKLLKRNLQRNLTNVQDEKEENEKMILSVFIVRFLKEASERAETQHHLDDNKRYMNSLMYYEHDRCINDIYRETPVLIEDTHMGNDLGVLLETISGKKSVPAFNYVSFRVLHKLAELMNGPYEEQKDEKEKRQPELVKQQNLSNNFSLSQQQALQELQDFFKKEVEDARQELQKKIKIEEDIQQWQKMTNFIEKNEKEKDGYFKKRYEVEQLFENLMKHIYEPQKNYLQEYEKDGNGNKIRDYIKKQIQEAFKSESSDEKDQSGQINNHRKERQRPKSPNLLKTMEAVEVGNDAQLKQSKDEYSIRHKKTNEKPFGISNQKLRSLCVAAFLRCVLGYIKEDLTYSHSNQERTPKLSEDADSRNEDWSYLSKSKVRGHLKAITELCQFTGWINANVGFKYIQVMYQVFQFNPGQWRVRYEEIEEYAILAGVVQEILVIFQEKISCRSYIFNENEKQLILTIVDMLTCLVYQLHFVDYFWTSVQGDEASRLNKQHQMLNKQMSIFFPQKIVVIIIDILQRVMYEEREQKIERDTSIKEEDQNLSYFSRPKDLLQKIMQFLAIHLVHEKISRSKDDTHGSDIIEKLIQNQIFKQSCIRQSYISEVIKMRDYWQLALLFENQNYSEFRDQRIRYVFKAECMVTKGLQMGSFETRLIMLSLSNLFIFDMQQMETLIDEIQQANKQQMTTIEESDVNNDVLLQRLEQKLRRKKAQKAGLLVHSFELADIIRYKIFIQDESQHEIRLFCKEKKLIEFKDSKTVHMIMPKVYDIEFEDIITMHKHETEQDYVLVNSFRQLSDGKPKNKKDKDGKPILENTIRVMSYVYLLGQDVLSKDRNYEDLLYQSPQESQSLDHRMFVTKQKVGQQSSSNLHLLVLTNQSLSLFKVDEKECSQAKQHQKYFLEQDENNYQPKQALQFEKTAKGQDIYWPLWGQETKQQVFTCINQEDLSFLASNQKEGQEKNENPEPSLAIVYKTKENDRDVPAKILFLNFISDYNRQELLEELREAIDKNSLQDDDS